MTALARLWTLARNREGSTLIEFAILAPVLLGLMFGVLQIGLGMRDYNALRSIAADTARYAVINYQGANKLSTTAIENYGISAAKAAPYKLLASGLSLKVTKPTTQRISGVTELSVTVTYITTSQLKILNINNPITLTFTRPIFVKT